MAQSHHHYLRVVPTPPPLPFEDRHVLPRVPHRRMRLNMTVIVDIEAILPENLRDPQTGQPVVNLDAIPMMTFYSEAQLFSHLVDHVKLGIQDLCWNCLRIPIRKRDFKLWLQVLPPTLPSHPYGSFEPLDFDSTLGDVLNSNQISFATERIVLRAHHPEGLFD